MSTTYDVPPEVSVAFRALANLDAAILALEASGIRMIVTHKRRWPTDRADAHGGFNVEVSGRKFHVPVEKEVVAVRGTSFTAETGTVAASKRRVSKRSDPEWVRKVQAAWTPEKRAAQSERAKKQRAEERERARKP